MFHITVQLLSIIFRIVDEMLPKNIGDASQNMLTILGSIIVVAVVNPYFLVPVFILITLFILIRKAYLKTSKELIRLEGIGEQCSKIVILLQLHSYTIISI